MTDEFEIQLIESALAGDIDSFGKLCGSYYNSMVAIAYSVLGDHHLAEDAAQETFAIALKNLAKLRQKRKFACWLARICRNVAKDMAKAQVRQKVTGDYSQAVDKGDEEHDSRMITEAMAALSFSERELIVLRYYNDFSYERMSAVLGISRAAVNGRLGRAKRKLATYLQRNGFDQVQL